MVEVEAGYQSWVEVLEYYVALVGKFGCGGLIFFGVDVDHDALLVVVERVEEVDV